MTKQFILIGIIVLGGVALGTCLALRGNTSLTFFQSKPNTEKAIKNLETRKPLTLLFGGDIMLDRYIRTVATRRGWEHLLTTPLRAKLQSADLALANLEGPITDNPSVSETSQMGEAKNYLFTFPPASADWLKQSGMDIVNLGNNHILNFGEAGAQETEVYLEQAGVQYFGSPVSKERVLFKAIEGVTIGFVNYNQFTPQGREKALADIARAKAGADVVILYAHWGKEYVEVLPVTKSIAHEFMDAGVDLIIGSHPHVVQEKEVYQGKTIYYSLGNFIFDQYFRPETKRGLIVEVALDPTTRVMTTQDWPIVLQPNGQTDLAE